MVNSYFARSEKSALVLSAGGMFGAYQAGVWDVISEVFHPDLIVGASVGSLNGYMIACGASPDELLSRWRNLDGISELRWRFPTSFTAGLIDPSALEMWIQETCCQRRPTSDYALVLTETLTCKPRMVRGPEVTWKHLAASCGVPGFLPTYRIDGVYYSDGGLIDPLPLWAALELGATTIVSVNLLNRRPLPVRALVCALRTYARYRRPSPGDVQVIEIAPSERLGSAGDSMRWSRRNADRWIELGQHDALATLDITGIKCLDRSSC
jgi:NTE family protein